MVWACSPDASRAYNKKISGYKVRGRPRKTWIEGVKETLTSHGISPLRASRLAVDRQLFSPHDAPEGTSGRIKKKKVKASTTHLQALQISMKFLVQMASHIRRIL